MEARCFTTHFVVTGHIYCDSAFRGSEKLSFTDTNPTGGVITNKSMQQPEHPSAPFASSTIDCPAIVDIDFRQSESAEDQAQTPNTTRMLDSPGTSPSRGALELALTQNSGTGKSITPGSPARAWKPDSAASQNLKRPQKSEDEHYSSRLQHLTAASSSTNVSKTADSTRVRHYSSDIQDPIRIHSMANASDSPVLQESTALPGGETEHATEFQDEIHLHLGARETAECIVNSLGKPDNYYGSYTFRFFSSSKKTPAVSAYRELFARKGSVVAQISRDQHDQLTQNLNSTFNCRVPRYSRYFGHCCVLRLRVPQGMYVAVAIPEHLGSRVVLYDSVRVKQVYNDFKATEDNKVEKRVFLSSSNIVNVLHHLQKHGNETFVLRFEALRSPGLEVRLTAFNRGVVRTPFHDGHSFVINHRLRYWVYVSIPRNHVIMTSLPASETLIHCLALYDGDRGNQTLFEVCRVSHEKPRPAVYNTSLLLLRLYTGRSVRPVGFQLRFSFHNLSAVPAKLSEDLWNCSASYLADFLYHLSCNMEVECPGATDETNCSYTTDLCGPGYLTIGGGCFFYVRRPKKDTSPKRASFICAKRGARLASLGTAEKWNGTVKLLLSSNYGTDDVLVGITNSPYTLPLWYRSTYRWADTVTGFYLVNDDKFLYEGCYQSDMKSCGYMDLSNFGNGRPAQVLLECNCTMEVRANILCEKPLPSAQHVIPMNGTDHWPGDSSHVKCPQGHYTHVFLACDVKTSCWFGDRSSYCKSSVTTSKLPPSFECADQVEWISYSLVCDYRPDCFDKSDEDFCAVPACDTRQFSCGNKQCISSTKLCDGWVDCFDGEDEEKCTFTHFGMDRKIPPPALVSISEKGRLIVLPLNIPSSSSSSLDKPERICPHTHVQCLDNGYCIPMFLRCNDVYDCPGHEDENGCDTCPGLYRCRDSRICLSHSQLCDGRAYCPQLDDELLCKSVCPPVCSCTALAFVCTDTFPASHFPFLRFLDASGSGVTPAQLTLNRMLISLTLSQCGLETLHGLDLPNLLSLDVRDNRLRNLSVLSLDDAPRLRRLSVAGNPLEVAVDGHRTFEHVHSLDLSRVALHVLNGGVLSAFPSLRVLNLSHSGVDRVLGEGFSVAKQLRVIDLRGCPVTWISRVMFQDLSALQTVYAHSYKLCCPALLPVDFKAGDCFAPSDEISSCDSMLRGKEYSVCVFVLSLLAVAGNTVSFVFRTFVSKRENKLGYGNFVTHLSVSDFLMGLYLAVIGVADQVYRGAYLWNDAAWRHSAACKLAGFLSLLSSEVSALIMCLITMDRFLVLRFPFSRLHFSPRSAHVSSFVVWIVGVSLVSVPLLPVTSHWEFYSQTGICIPLPITRIEFAGHDYSFSILIVFNFVLFVFISLGQLSIYMSVRANKMSVSNTTKKSKDLTIARRLITVAMTDFLCWFPIGVLGLLASKGFPIPGEVNVAVAIFVLPLNAAVNPCLYTVNVILERRRRACDEKLRTILLAQLKTLS